MTIMEFTVLFLRSVPKVETEVESETQRPGNLQFSPTSWSQSTRLVRFLNNLELLPNEPPCDLNDTNHDYLSLNGTSRSSLNNDSTAAIYVSSNINPEADSFTYMETLLESLAVLGKLGNALDNTAQRLPGEIFALVETTLDEVEERAEYSRRSLFALTSGLGKSEGVYIFDRCHPGPVDVTVGTKIPLMKSSSLRLSALESLEKRADHDILKDLFWTLYSKLDAVAQGLRVVTEITTRIGSVCLIVRLHFLD
jgi:exocyst complex component 4